MAIGKELFPERVWIAERISPAVADLELGLNTLENTFEFTSFPDHQHWKHMSDIDPPCAEILTVLPLNSRIKVTPKHY